MNFILRVSVLIVIAVTFSYAQTDSVSSGRTFDGISLSGGASYPSIPSRFSDRWLRGLNIGASAGYSLEPGSVGYTVLFAHAEYNHFRADNEGIIEDIGMTGRRVRMKSDRSRIYSVTGNIRGTFTALGESVQPYFLLGIGYMNIDVKDVSVTGDTTFTLDGERVSAFTWRAGVGFNVRVTQGISLFAEAKYAIAVTNDPPGWQYYPISVGVRIKTF